MHNLYAIFAKFLDICKMFSTDLVNEKGNIPRRGVVSKFSDLEVISLSLAAESIGIDSESFLFSKLNEYKDDFSSLISRRQYNDRRKLTIGLCNQVRERIASNVDGGEDIFCIDSMPIEVCRPIRSKRSKMGKNNYDKAPWLLCFICKQLQDISIFNAVSIRCLCLSCRGGKRMLC